MYNASALAEADAKYSLSHEDNALFCVLLQAVTKRPFTKTIPDETECLRRSWICHLPISVANFLICAGAVLLAVNLLQLAGTWNLIMKKQTIA